MSARWPAGSRFGCVDAADRVVDEVLATATGLDTLTEKGSRHTREGFTLRWTLHRIEGYARHDGHAEEIRESIDGATGE